MADFDAGSIEGSLELNRDPFIEGLRMSQEDAEDFESREYRARIGLDSDDANIELDDLEARLDDLEAHDYTAHVDVDTDNARRDIEDLEADLGREGSGSGGSGGEGLLGKFGLLAGVMTKVGLGLGIASLPAIVASVVPAVVGLGGLFGVLAAGIGATGLVAKSDFTDMQATLKDLTTQQQNLNNATTDAQRQAALKAIAADTEKLQGPAGQAAKAYQAIETAMANLKSDTAGAVFPVMTEFFKTVADAIPKIAPLITATSKALLPFAQDLDKAVNGPGFTKLIGFLSSSIGPALNGVGSFLLNVGDGALNIFKLLSPLATVFGSSIGTIAKNFNDWSKTLDSSSFTPFFNFIKQNGPLVSQTFRDLAKALGGIAEGIAPLSGPALSLLDKVFQNIGKVNLGPLAKAVGDVAYALIPLLPSLANLANDIIPILADALEYVVIPDLQILSGILKWLTNGSVLSDVALGILGAAAAMWGLDAALDANPIGVVILAVALLAAGIYELVTHFKQVSDFLHGPWGTAISLFVATIFPVIGIPMLIMGHWKDLQHFFETFWDAIKTAWNASVHWLEGVGKDVEKAWDAVVKFFEGVPGKIMDELKKLPGQLEQAAEWAIAGFIVGIAYQAIFIYKAFTDLYHWIITFFEDAPGWLEKAGEWVITGLWSGLKAIWLDTSHWFESLPTNIKNWFSDALNWLEGPGENIIKGLWNGIYSFVTGTVWPWFRGLPQDIENMGSDFINTLWNAGKALMEGLLNGIKAGWNDVKSFVGGIGSKIADLKGPLDYDRALLIPHGNAIMDGLGEGIDTGFTRVSSKLRDIGNKIKNTTFGATGNMSLTSQATIAVNSQAQLAATAAVAGQLATVAQAIKSVPESTGEHVASKLKPVLQQQTQTGHMLALQRGRQGAAGFDGS